MESTVRVFINSCLNLKLTNVKFPGAMPVSIDQTHIPRIRGVMPEKFTEYVTSTKLDGERFFMGLLNVNGHPNMFLVNRRFEVMCKRVSDVVHSDYFAGTLFDVEVIGIDIVIFDCITCCGQSVRHLSYLHRIEMCRAFLHDCYNSEVVESNQYTVKSNFKTHRVAITPTLILNTKPVFHMKHVAQVSSQWPDDGLIFTEVAQPYEPYRSSETTIFKWKPAHRITIDFEIIPRNVHFTLSSEWPVQFMQLQGRSSLRLGTTIVSHISTEHKGICECYWEGVWIVVQTRPDKTKPNSLDTGIRTLQSIDAAIDINDFS